MKHTIISIEGTDGSGKRTQSENLHKYFIDNGKESILLSFPNYDSPSSSPVKMYLGGEFGDKATCLDAYQGSSLYAVDRLCTMKKLINELSKPTYIILDRYVQSNMIHQAGKIKDSAELDKFLDWVDNHEFDILKLPRANKVLFLDVPPAVSTKIAQARTEQKTGNKKDIHEKDTKHLEDAYRSAHYVAKKFNWEVVNCLDKNGNLDTREAIFKKILSQLKNVVSIDKKKEK